MTDYRPGSITSLLAAASAGIPAPPSSKQRRLKALFAAPPPAEAARTPAIKSAESSAGRKRCRETGDVAPDASQGSERKVRKRLKALDGGSKIVYDREAGLRNADSKVKKTKEKRKKKKHLVVTARSDNAFANQSDVKESPTLQGTETPIQSGVESEGGRGGRDLNSANARARVKQKAEWIKHAYVRPKDDGRDRRTVFVGNVAVGVDKKTLQKLFRTCGTVESVRIRSVPVATMKLPKRAVAITKEFHPARHNMNAYVIFVSEESAHKALALNGTELDNLHIRVDLAESEKSKHDHRRSIFIGNMPYKAEEETLRRHFVDCGLVDNVRIIRDARTGMGKGFGYVSFQDRSSVDLALLLDREEMEGRTLRIQRSSEHPRSVTSGGARGDTPAKGPSAMHGRSNPPSAHNSTSAASHMTRSPSTKNSNRIRVPSSDFIPINNKPGVKKKLTREGKSLDMSATLGDQRARSGKAARGNLTSGGSAGSGKGPRVASQGPREKAGVRRETKSEKRLRKKEIRRVSREKQKLGVEKLLGSGGGKSAG